MLLNRLLAPEVGVIETAASPFKLPVLRNALAEADGRKNERIKRCWVLLLALVLVLVLLPFPPYVDVVDTADGLGGGC
jgi:hypothetical protein